MPTPPALPRLSHLTAAELDKILLGKCTCGHLFSSHSEGTKGPCLKEDEWTGARCACPYWELYERSELCDECKHPSEIHFPNDPKPCKVAPISGSSICMCPGFRNLSLGIAAPAVATHPSRKDKSMTTTKSTTPLEYVLPGGRTYVERSLGGYSSDVEGMRELRKMGKHPLLLGDPGCGKTALIIATFPDVQNEIGHDKLTAFDMLWRPRPMPDGTIQFDPSPLNRAVTLGLPFYIDEIMRCNADALTPLFSAMDGRGYIVSGNIDGTDLPIKEGFIVVAASNPLVRGAFLPDAILSRFHVLSVETSEDLLVKLGLDEKLLVIWRNLGKLENGEMWRPSVRDLLSAQSFIDAGNLQQAAYALTGFRVPARDREIVAGVIGPMLGVRVTAAGGVIK